MTKLTEENKANIREWITELRSGDYTQGRGALRKLEALTEGPTVTYCCLGVASEMLENRGVEFDVDRNHKAGNGAGFIRADPGDDATDLNELAPEEVCDAMGFDVNTYTFLDAAGIRQELFRLNDVKRYTFDEIADILEREFLND